MKTTLASLSALVTSLQGQIAHQGKQIERLEIHRKRQAIEYLKSKDVSSVIELPSNFDSYSPEAQARIRDSMARRAQLRNKQVAH